MQNLSYISYEIKFKNSMNWLKIKAFRAYYHDVRSDDLTSHISSIEKKYNNWISYVCVRIVRTIKYETDETFLNKENRIFIRKNDKFIEFNGRFDRNSKLTI